MNPMKEPRPLMETNVYSVRGRVLVVGSCLPEAFMKLASEADQVYSLCLETTHINIAVTGRGKGKYVFRKR